MFISDRKVSARQAFEGRSAPELRLGTYKLPTVEVCIVRSMVHLLAIDRGLPWTLVDAPPFDALLVDGIISKAERFELARVAGSMVVLADEGSDGRAETVVRPIRVDKLRQWLCSVESSLRAMEKDRASVGE